MGRREECLRVGEKEGMSRVGRERKTEGQEQREGERRGARLKMREKRSLKGGREGGKAIWERGEGDGEQRKKR